MNKEGTAVRARGRERERLEAREKTRRRIERVSPRKGAQGQWLGRKRLSLVWEEAQPSAPRKNP